MLGTEWSEAAKTTLSELITDFDVKVTLPGLENVTVESESSVVELKIEDVSVAETLKSKKVGFVSSCFTI